MKNIKEQKIYEICLTENLNFYGRSGSGKTLFLENLETYFANQSHSFIHFLNYHDELNGRFFSCFHRDDQVFIIKSSKHPISFQSHSIDSSLIFENKDILSYYIPLNYHYILDDIIEFNKNEQNLEKIKDKLFSYSHFFNQEFLSNISRLIDLNIIEKNGSINYKTILKPSFIYVNKYSSETESLSVFLVNLLSKIFIKQNKKYSLIVDDSFNKKYPIQKNKNMNIISGFYKHEEHQQKDVDYNLILSISPNYLDSFNSEIAKEVLKLTRGEALFVHNNKINGITKLYCNEVITSNNFFRNKTVDLYNQLNEKISNSITDLNHETDQKNKI